MYVRSDAVTVKPCPTGAVAPTTTDAGRAAIALVAVQPAIRRVVNSFLVLPARRRTTTGVTWGTPLGHAMREAAVARCAVTVPAWGREIGGAWARSSSRLLARC